MNADGWFITYTGRQFFPLRPSVDDVSIEDIAHALANVCRFGGHVREFYSVAQHSIWVSEGLPPALRMHGLMHDAAEAYLGDVITPVKRCVPRIAEIEADIMHVINTRFGLRPLDDNEKMMLKAVDTVALMTERRDLIRQGPWAWVEDEAQHKPAPAWINPMPARFAETAFTERWVELGGFIAR